MKNEKILKEITLAEAVVQSSPHPFALLLSGFKEKKNIMGISWYTLASMKPGKMIFAVSQKNFTTSLIEKHSFVSLCIPLESIKDEAMQCCKSSGREINKIAEFKIELIECKDKSTFLVKESSVAWILKVCDKMSIGDHNLYIADIIGCYGNGSAKGIMAFEGYKRLDVL